MFEPSGAKVEVIRCLLHSESVGLLLPEMLLGRKGASGVVLPWHGRDGFYRPSGPT